MKEPKFKKNCKLFVYKKLRCQLFFFVINFFIFNLVLIRIGVDNLS